MFSSVFLSRILSFFISSAILAAIVWLMQKFVYKIYVPTEDYNKELVERLKAKPAIDGKDAGQFFGWLGSSILNTVILVVLGLGVFTMLAVIYGHLAFFWNQLTSL